MGVMRMVRMMCMRGIVGAVMLIRGIVMMRGMVGTMPVVDVLRGVGRVVTQRTVNMVGMMAVVCMVHIPPLSAVCLPATRSLLLDMASYAVQQFL